VKRKKAMVLGGGLLISVMISVMVLAGMLFYPYSDQFDGEANGFEQEGDDA